MTMKRYFPPLLAVLAMAGCSAREPGPDPAGTSLPSDCVPLAEGLYEFRDGRFLAVSGAPDLPVNKRTAWANEISYALKAAGLEGIRISVNGPVAIVAGSAGDRRMRDYAYMAAKAAIEAHPEAGAAGLFILDAVSLASEPPAPGLALMPGTGDTEQSCQEIFDVLLTNGIIQFESGTARISPVSHPLLDALAATAMLCETDSLEIGSHTDARGAEDYNLRLSQERADAIRAWMISKGVPGTRLIARGYGESQLIDLSGTPTAHGINRRTQIRVLPPGSVPETENQPG